MSEEESSTPTQVIPIVADPTADFAHSLHMIPPEKAGSVSPVGVTVPEKARNSFRGTPFAGLYDEALNLLRSRNITPEELRYISHMLNHLMDKRGFSPFYVRQGRLSDVDALEDLIKYWAHVGENLPRPRADIVRNIDSFAVCEREGRMVGCASLYV